jgi:hypothetical protein
MKILAKSAGLTAFFLVVGNSVTRAHTWIEELLVIASNGTMVGAPGYPRGFVSRATPGFNDGQMDYLIPPNGRPTGNQILPTDLMCKSTQNIGSQTPGFPVLNASPGDMIALRYQENGHVTNPGVPPGKPANGGTVYIYGTQKPSDSDTLLAIHKVWNAAGTGGNGNGILLATRNFDDGQCYQVDNAHALSVQRQKEFPHKADPLMGEDLWCQTDVTLPSNIAASDSYTLYWVWDWPTGTPGVGSGVNEIYTTCMDVNLVAGPGTSKNLNFIKGQDLNKAAIETELSTAFNVPVTATNPSTASPTGEAESSSIAAATTQKPIAAQPNTATNAMTVTETIHDVVTIFRTIYTASSSTSAQVVVTVTTDEVTFTTITMLAPTPTLKPRYKIRGRGTL